MKTKLYLLFIFVLVLNVKAQVTEVQPLRFNYKANGVQKTNVPFDTNDFKQKEFISISFVFL